MARMFLLLGLAALTIASSAQPVHSVDPVKELSESCAKLSDPLLSLGCQAQTDTLQTRVDAMSANSIDAKEVRAFRDGEIARIKEEFGMR